MRMRPIAQPRAETRRIAALDLLIVGIEQLAAGQHAACQRMLGQFHGLCGPVLRYGNHLRIVRGQAGLDDDIEHAVGGHLQIGHLAMRTGQLVVVRLGRGIERLQHAAHLLDMPADLAGGLHNVVILQIHLQHEVGYAGQGLVDPPNRLLHIAAGLGAMLDLGDHLGRFVAQRFDRAVDLVGGTARAAGQFLHFIGHHGKGGPGVSRLFRLDRGVERQHIGGARDIVDRLGAALDLVHRARKSGHMLAKRFHQRQQAFDMIQRGADEIGALPQPFARAGGQKPRLVAGAHHLMLVHVQRIHRLHQRAMVVAQARRRSDDRLHDARNIAGMDRDLAALRGQLFQCPCGQGLDDLVLH